MKRLLLSLAVVAITIPLSYAQTADDLFFFGQRAPAVGARMTAMGGASVAGLGDWNAAYANPAGLGYLRSRQAVASGHAYMQGTGGRGYGIDVETEGLSLGGASVATPIPVSRGAMAVGIGYNETAVYTRGVSDDGFGSGGYFSNESGFQGEVSVAGAAAISPRAMLGLSVNAPIGRYSFDQQFSGGDAAPAFDAEIYGANVRTGLSVEVTPAVRLGLTVESPTLLYIDETGPEFGRNEYRITTPWRVAVGVLTSSPHALVSADIEFVDWSQARFQTDTPAFEAENANADRFLNPVFNARVGAEYRFGSVALRAGAAFQPDPRFDSFEPDVVRKHYAVGLGVNVSPSARLDIALAHTQLGDGVRGAIFDQDGYILWDVDHAFRSSLQVGMDVRF